MHRLALIAVLAILAFPASATASTADERAEFEAWFDTAGWADIFSPENGDTFCSSMHAWAVVDQPEEADLWIEACVATWAAFAEVGPGSMTGMPYHLLEPDATDEPLRTP